MFIIRSYLAIGKLRETLHLDLLRENNIDAMLQLCREYRQPGIESLFLPVIDREPLPEEMLRGGVAFVREQKAQGRTVLVACGRGISRSAAFATAVLREEEGGSLPDALRQIRAVHPEAKPHPTLWASLCLYYREIDDLYGQENRRGGR